MRIQPYSFCPEKCLAVQMRSGIMRLGIITLQNAPS